jgi:hypothetical protein
MPPNSTAAADMHSSLLTELAAVLDKYGVGDTFDVVFRPDGLRLQADEVLVQRVLPCGRRLVLEPRHKAELDVTDDVHDAQSLGMYTQPSRQDQLPANCYTVYTEIEGSTRCITAYKEDDDEPT